MNNTGAKQRFYVLKSFGLSLQVSLLYHETEKPISPLTSRTSHPAQHIPSTRPRTASQASANTERPRLQPCFPLTQHMQECFRLSPILQSVVQLVCCWGQHRKRSGYLKSLTLSHYCWSKAGEKAIHHSHTVFDFVLLLLPTSSSRELLNGAVVSPALCQFTLFHMSDFYTHFFCLL